ncbi:hypothetical protein BBK36DRAFT_1199300 [Trichoderma citrinoviride]|uniref:F-box domain-containing protein n=1 Tax=Trichoderma citrinoviride TaxID=58853 RepID=A0A2T4BCX0_9HYPO|nr:hypothetical protein BBK36DRAFT_1199300 [Trichoderma citrinoviride]PTB67039.1 hypothetical protein BBK36DRAFT_1199300 [Trichoderma citrinoviride]
MTSTATIKAFPLPPAFTAADLYSIDEHSDDGAGAASSKEQVPRVNRTARAASQSSAYPVHPGQQNGPSRFQNGPPEAFHAALKRPQKLAGASSANNNNNHNAIPSNNMNNGGRGGAAAAAAAATGSGSHTNNPVYRPPPPLAQEGITGPRKRAASVGNRMHLNTLETSSWVRENVYLTSPIRSAFKNGPDRRPDELFSLLPGEVLDLVLRSLRGLHLDKSSDSCATCMMRDLCSAALCSRRWYKHARAVLYEDIQLVGSDSAAHKKRFKQNQGNRMALLRRTLRSNPDIAGLVRSLKVPHPEPPLNWSASKGMLWLEQYEDRVAALVMACPKLERLSGPTPNYDHSFKKIFHALSTRTALKDMTWILEPAPAPQGQQQQRTDSPSKQRGQSGPSMLEPSQGDAFLSSHRNWTSLSKLSILCQPGATLAPHRLLSKTLTYLCNLPPNAFNDNNLLSLPPLKSLILSRIVGITSGGLTTFATRANTSRLERLELRHTPLTSLPALARIFSHLPSLRVFALAQSFPPVMPETDSFALWMMPYLASASIVKLHWDITSHPATTNSADDILARSIEAGGFPALAVLRTPNDPEARFQALCRPVHHICLPTDRFYRHNTLVGGTTTNLPASGSFSAPSSPVSPIHKSATTMSLPATIYAAPSSPGTDLHKARLAAQARLEAAHDVPRFTFNVTDDDGQVAQTFGVAGFLGTLGSKITYHLLPDDGATDEQGGLVDVIDLVGDGGEALAGGREGCTGRWNQKEGEVADKKEKEKWWHTERGRWRRIEA